jgi:quercetin dioxygenase-like cupin family protein
MATAPRTAIKRDPVKLDNRHYKVELETHLFRIIRVTYGPNEKSPMHEHPPCVTVMLTDADFRFTYPNGGTEQFEKKAGEFMVSGGSWEHQQENLSGKSFETLLIELKT